MILVPANQFQGDLQEPTLELSFRSLEDPIAMSIYKITQPLIKHRQTEQTLNNWVLIESPKFTLMV